MKDLTVEQGLCLCKRYQWLFGIVTVVMVAVAVLSVAEACKSIDSERYAMAFVYMVFFLLSAATGNMSAMLNDYYKEEEKKIRKEFCTEGGGTCVDGEKSETTDSNPR